MTKLVGEIEQDPNRYKGQSILNIVENMKHDCVEEIVDDFCLNWCVSKDAVMYAAMNYRNGVIPNENVIKIKADYTKYREKTDSGLRKFMYYNKMLASLKHTLDEEVKPLISNL